MFSSQPRIAGLVEADPLPANIVSGTLAANWGVATRRQADGPVVNTELALPAGHARRQTRGARPL